VMGGHRGTRRAAGIVPNGRASGLAPPVPGVISY
jgi:hypothetical protein